MRHRVLAIIPLLALCAFTAFPLESVDFYGGLQWIGSPTFEPASIDGEPTGGPSPILNSYAIGFPFALGRFFRLAPELTLFGTQYGLIPGYEKTVPVEREFANAVWFLGVLVELSFWLDIPLSESLGVGISVGAAFLGRIPIADWGTGWDELPTMAGYFYGVGRYFYPDAGLFFTWRPASLDRLEVSIRTKGYVPIFHLWDDEEVTFLDQFMVGVSVGLRVYPKERSALPEAPASGPSPDESSPG